MRQLWMNVEYYYPSKYCLVIYRCELDGKVDFERLLTSVCLCTGMDDASKWCDYAQFLMVVCAAARMPDLIVSFTTAIIPDCRLSSH